VGRARLTLTPPRRRCATLVLALLALASLEACKNKKGPQGQGDGGVSGVSNAAPPPVSISAASAAHVEDSGLPARPSTTPWSIASNNLDADIKERSEKRASTPDEHLFLVDLYLTRAQFVANVADVEKADAIGEQSVKSYPTSAVSHLAHAVTLGALHRFPDEAKELDEAARLGASRFRVASARVALLMATGHYDDAQKLMTPIDERSSPTALVTAAVLAGKMQKHDEAERLFERTRGAFVDVSPFPVAWMDFQRAALLEANGKEKEARPYYLEALEVIPAYVHAAVHASVTDTPEAAIARLEALRTSTTDPDLLAALADAHRRAKHDGEAKKVTEAARARYEELVAKHPEAYRDHAARFWLAGGNDPKKALDLAEKNAQLRPTEEAIDLWMAAAAAADRKDQICASAIAMKQLRYASEQRKRLAAAASNGCSDAPKK
jgi:tetratricopeptide (TPR) repeat protein